MGYIQLAAAKYRGGVDAGEEEGAVVQVAAAASRSAPAAWLGVLLDGPMRLMRPRSKEKGNWRTFSWEALGSFFFPFAPPEFGSRLID